MKLRFVKILTALSTLATLVAVLGAGQKWG
jgi:hypothetical protein